METATSPFRNTASACARRSLALFPTIRRRSFAGVSMPSAAKSRAMTRAADASMCTPSAVSNARVASRSDIEGVTSSSSETSSSSSSSETSSSSSSSETSSSSLFFSRFLRTETSSRFSREKRDSARASAGSSAPASRGSSAARIATAPRSVRPRANAAAAPSDTRWAARARGSRSALPRDGPRTRALFRKFRRDAETGVERDPAERRSMLSCFARSRFGASRATKSASPASLDRLRGGAKTFLSGALYRTGRRRERGVKKKKRKW